MAQPKDKQIVYKLVGIDTHQTMRGLYDDTVIYRVGKLMRQKARDHHEGGYYAMRSVAEVLSGQGGVGRRGRTALLECEAWGTSVQYFSGKIAWSNLRPLRVVAVLTNLRIDNKDHRALIREAFDNYDTITHGLWQTYVRRDGSWDDYESSVDTALRDLDAKIIAILGGTDNGQES